MQMLMKVQFPLQKFNAAVRDGSVGDKLGKILGFIKPKGAFFTAENGCRGGTFVVEVHDPKQMPQLAEPFFLLFDAKVEYLPYMTPEDLAHSGLEKMNEMWP